MRKTLQILTIGFFLSICSYGQNASNERVKLNNVETRIDSLRLDKVMKDAVKLARTNIQADNYIKEYKTQPDDSSYVITVNVTIGHLFSENQRHLLIRRQVPWCAYIN